MAADRRPNKSAASEDEVGLIHKLTTKLHLARLKEMMELISSGANAEDVIGDGKALQAAGKWAADQNSITCAAPEASEETELAQQLRAIREEQGGKLNGTNGNVIPFDDGED